MIGALKSNAVKLGEPATRIVWAARGSAASSRARTALIGRYSGWSWSRFSDSATATPAATTATTPRSGAQASRRTRLGRQRAATDHPSASHVHIPAGEPHHIV